MIRFQCQHCAVKLTVRENRAGTIGRCPRCKAAITIPQSPKPESSLPADDEELTLIAPAAPQDKALLDLPDEQELADREQERLRREEQLLTSLGVTQQPQHTGERRFAWPVDILLYPTSTSGLMVLVLLAGIPLMLGFIHRVVPTVGFLGLPLFVGSIIFGLYVGWYFAECVHDSARGGTRAPEAFAAGLSLGEMWSRVSYLLAVYIIYLLPVVLYRIIVNQTDVVFWTLAGYALVFFPMGLLAMVVDDSISALNPFFLLGSVFRTFFPYAGLVLLFATLGGLLWLTAQGQGETDEPQSLWLEAIGLVTSTYGAFLVAHILGRFYWRHRERLDWGL